MGLWPVAVIVLDAKHRYKRFRWRGDGSTIEGVFSAWCLGPCSTVMIIAHHCHLFGKVEVVAKPFPQLDLLNRKSRVAVGQGQEEVPPRDGDGEDHGTSHPSALHAPAAISLASGDMFLRPSVASVNGVFIDRISVKDELEKSASHEA